MTSTPDSNPSVSVVIPTHNRADRLPALLDAVAAQAEEIVVVANACTDETEAVLADQAGRHRQLKPLAVPEPGQMLALQAGVEAADGEVVLLLDDDVFPEPGLLAGHARHHAAAEGLVVVGYMPVAMPERRRRGEFPAELYSRSYEEACAAYDSDADAVLSGLWAGNVSLRRADALRVGVAPQRPLGRGFGYHGDRDFGLRCAAAGLRGRFDRQLRATHRFERDEAGFLRAAYDSGQNRVAILAARGETFDPDFYPRSVPYPGRLLVRLASRRRAKPVIQALLGAATRAAGRLRLFRLEAHAGYVMGVIEQQRGALDAAAASAGPG